MNTCCNRNSKFFPKILRRTLLASKYLFMRWMGTADRSTGVRNTEDLPIWMQQLFTKILQQKQHQRKIFSQAENCLIEEWPHSWTKNHLDHTLHKFRAGLKDQPSHTPKSMSSLEEQQNSSKYLELCSKLSPYFTVEGWALILLKTFESRSFQLWPGYKEECVFQFKENYQHESLPKPTKQSQRNFISPDYLLPYR
jgi:hypothetical protein